MRLYQVLRRLVGFARTLTIDRTPPSDRRRATLMSAAANSRLIPIDSDVYRRGLAQFEANLSEILKGYARAGVPVYVATLASNERDLPPFVGGPSDSVDAQAWRAAGGGDRAAIESRIALDPAAADPWYALGQLELRAERPDAAREAFRRARDLDRLRFRAPSAFNEIVRRLAARYGAVLVDVEAAFAARSPDGIVGRELVSEHVHPTADGYFWLADAFFRALLEDGRVVAGPHAPTTGQARAEMPITEVDRLLADHSVRELTSDFPFREEPVGVGFPEPRDPIERIAAQRFAGERSWLESMEALLQHHREAGRPDRAAIVARIAAQAYPEDSAPNLSAGLLYTELGRWALARRYLERALRGDPENAAAHRALARADAADR